MALEASKTSFQLVNVEVGAGMPPVSLLRMENSKGQISFVLIQVHAALFPMMSLTSFKTLLMKHKGFKTLSGIDCFWAFKLGACSSHHNSLNVVSICCLLKAAQQVGLRLEIQSSLASLRQPGGYTILQFPEEVLKLNCQPDLNPSSIHVPLPLPTSLPPCPAPAAALHRKYGLQQVKPQLVQAVILKMQLEQLKLWATSDFQLDRKGGALQHSTWQHVYDQVLLFLGFCHLHMKVQQPTLQHFLMPHLILAFVSFHIAKECSPLTIKHHLQTASKVLSWWRTKAGGHDAGLQKMIQEWLPNLSEQVGRAISRPPAKALHELPTAVNLVAAIQQQQDKVLQTYAKEGMTAKLARSLHDLALLCTIFAHLPPIRLSCIRALMVPTYSGTCLNPDCKHGPSCHGNQLQPTPQHGLHMHLPHHKNERRWKRASICFDVPAMLAKLLRLHVYKGWEMLTTYMCVEDACHVFVDRQGRPFTSSNFTMYWTRLMQDMGLPAFSPSQCRQVFVSERRSADKVEGPNERGAAMIMGHSVSQWDKWYDLNFHARQAQEAVDAMTTWREALLARASKPHQQLAEQPQPHAPLQQQQQPQPVQQQPQHQPLQQRPHPLAALLHGSAASSSSVASPPRLAMPLELSEDDICVDIDDRAW